MGDFEIFFPRWTKKAITFTIDDGNITLDRKFIGIVKPAGITGTFNLPATSLARYKMTKEELVEFYKGYEISNHCNHHPLCLSDDIEYFEADALTPENMETDRALVKTDIEGLYESTSAGGRYCKKATAETYIRLIAECKRDLEEIFGEGSVTSFVWPYCDQKNEKIHKYLSDAGYTAVRTTGRAIDFNLPADRMRWIYNADHANMTERIKEFEALGDDGSLKWFCFGVHSHDFENNNCWDVLENFAAEYGNRPDDFWYATVRDILEYEDAVKALEETENAIINNSDKTLHVKINGKKLELSPKTRVEI